MFFKINGSSPGRQGKEMGIPCTTEIDDDLSTNIPTDYPSKKIINIHNT